MQRVQPGTLYGAGFEGPIYRPGASLTDEEMGTSCVALECAGPVGSWRRGTRRETLWILWRWDSAICEWIEIARAQALDWTWATVLREPAIRAMRPLVDDLVDVTTRGRELAEQILASLDTALVPEPPEVRVMVLTSLYDQMAGRIVAA